MFTKAEQWSTVVDHVTSLAKDEIPTIATSLGATIVTTTGVTDYVGAEGTNLFTFRVTSDLSGATPTRATLETLISQAGYQVRPTMYSYSAAGESTTKDARIYLTILDEPAATVRVTLTPYRELSLSDAETKRLRELYSIEPVEISLQK
jgi:hypothetical protein